MDEVKFETAKEARKKEFEDTEVMDLYNQNVEPLEKKSNALDNQVKELIQTNREKIGETNRKFEKRKKEHLSNYEREFHYKSMSELDLIQKTLKKAIPFLESKDKSLTEKMEYIKMERGGNLEILRAQVNELESKANDLEAKMEKVIL